MELSKNLQKAIADIFSSNDSVVLKALDVVKNEGNEQVINPLLDLLITTKSDLIRNEVLSILNTIKNPKAAPVLVGAIQNPKYALFKPELIAACWENGLNYSPYLSVFVEELINEDYLVGIEAITLIENLSPPYNYDEIHQCLNKLEKAYFEDNPMKQELIKSCGKILSNMLTI
jgi:hypothetical protein